MPRRPSDHPIHDPGAGPSARERRREHSDRLIRIRALVEEGLTEEEIAEVAGLDAEEVGKLVRDCVVEEMRFIGSLQPEEVYARFVMESRGNLRRCDELYEKFQRGDQVAGLVGVVKLRQSISESVLKRGQDMGFVKKEPNKTFVLTANLNGPDLRQYVAETLSKIRKDMVEAGDEPFLELGQAPASVTRALPPPRASELVRTVEPRLASDASPVVRRKVIRPSTARSG